MQIVERVENPLLNRVELKFMWPHPNAKTPSLAAMVSAALKAEPGSIREQIFVLGVNTRFGQTTTSGLIHVYESPEAAAREANYLIERHQRRGAHNAPKEEQAVPVAEPPKETADEAAEEAAEVVEESSKGEAEPEAEAAVSAESESDEEGA